MAEKRKASEAYLAKLRDPRWQKRRLEILNRDSFTCQFCWDTKTTLHIHHLEYTWGKEPWEYGDESLLTLCETCHEFERERPEVEKKLLRTLRMAKISTDTLDCIAAPTALGAQNLNHFTRALGILLNADIVMQGSIEAAIQCIQDRLAPLLAVKDEKKAGDEGNA